MGTAKPFKKKTQRNSARSWFDDTKEGYQGHFLITGHILVRKYMSVLGFSRETEKIEYTGDLV